MKKIFLLVLTAVLLSTSAVYAGGLEIKQKSGDYNVAVRLDKNPAIVGNNSMQIEIRDGLGHPVTDAKIRVNYSMPAMPGMPAMNYGTNAVLTGSAYAAKINLSMSGSWNVALRITRGGKTSTMKFNVDA
jgi:hypothetical protein